MPVVGFKGVDNSLIDFEDYEDNLDRIPFPSPLVHVMVKEILENPHKGEYISVTALLGCMRQMYISRIFNVYVDPKNAWYTLRGSLIHSLLEYQGKNTDHLLVEEDFITEFEGCELGGRIDLYNKRTKHLTDFKTIGDNGLHFVLNSAKTDHIRQVNLYRLLLEKNNFPVKSASIIYMTLKDVIETGKPSLVKYRGDNITRTPKPIELYPLEDVEKFAEERTHILSEAFSIGKLPPIPDKKTQKWMCTKEICSVANVCPFYQELIAKGEREE